MFISNGNSDTLSVKKFSVEYFKFQVTAGDFVRCTKSLDPLSFLLCTGKIPGPRTLFILNSAEHEIHPAHVGILTFISRINDWLW